MKYKKFNGKRIEEVAKHRKDISFYCHNFYEDTEGNLIYQWSDDDGYADYCLVTFDEKGRKVLHDPFAESFCSYGNIIEVFEDFMNEE